MDGATEYYSAVAAQFHQSYAADPNRLERLAVWRRFLDRYAPGCRTAYDIGCGSGVITQELALRVGHVTAIDGAAGMLAIARATLQNGGHRNVEFREAQLPLADVGDLKPADIAISSSAIEYMESIPEALAFASRLLVGGGILIFSVSNRASVSRKLARLLHRLTGRPRYLAFLRHFLTPDELKLQLPAAHLRDIEHLYFGGADPLNRFLARLLPPARANNMILMVARKEGQPGSQSAFRPD